MDNEQRKFIGQKLDNLERVVDVVRMMLTDMTSHEVDEGFVDAARQDLQDYAKDIASYDGVLFRFATDGLEFKVTLKPERNNDE